MSEVFYIDQVEPEPLRAAVVPGSYEFTLRDDINPQALKSVSALIGALGKGEDDEATLEKLGTLAPALLAFLRAALVSADADELQAHVDGEGDRPVLGVRRMIALTMWAVRNVVGGLSDDEQEGDEEVEADPEAPAGGAAGTRSASTSPTRATSRARGSSPAGPSKPSARRTSSRSSRRR